MARSPDSNAGWFAGALFLYWTAVRNAWAPGSFSSHSWSACAFGLPGICGQNQRTSAISSRRCEVKARSRQYILAMPVLPVETADVAQDNEMELQRLLDLLPPRISVFNSEDLQEIVLDDGRPPIGRFGGFDGQEIWEEVLAAAELTSDELQSIYHHPAVSPWTPDNRAFVDGTLHRISCILNLDGAVIGLTLRAGRPRNGLVGKIDDIVKSGCSTLLLGGPGSGKTTALREYARVLSDVYGRRVVIVDTGNELGGGGNVPHVAVGLRTRRLMVPSRDQQLRVMLEAVQNHNPEVLVVDEIGTFEEASAAASIAHRGIQLIAAATGRCVEQLVQNVALSSLLGGVEIVTADDAMIRLQRDGRTILQRRVSSPPFQALVELEPRVGQSGTWRVYRDLARAVDSILLYESPLSELRADTDSASAPAARPAGTELYPSDALVASEPESELDDEQLFSDNNEFALLVRRLLRRAGNMKVRQNASPVGRGQRVLSAESVAAFLEKIQEARKALEVRLASGEPSEELSPKKAASLLRASDRVGKMQKLMFKGRKIVEQLA